MNMDKANMCFIPHYLKLPLRSQRTPNKLFHVDNSQISRRKYPNFSPQYSVINENTMNVYTYMYLVGVYEVYILQVY